MSQHRLDSLMESLTNTAIGFIISLVTWQIVAAALGIPMPLGRNLLITSIFTVVSIARQYWLRRLFNGRSVYSYLKGRFL
jgi:hypothetical protein